MQFEPYEQWIWLPEDKYPERQTTVPNTMGGYDMGTLGNYTVVRCEKTYRTGKPIVSAEIRTSGDTFFRLYVNGKYAVSGPASVGGDFLSNERIRDQHYAVETVLDASHPGLCDGQLEFSAVVRVCPVKMFEYSQAHGGFFLTAHVRFADGTKTVLRTDSDWNMTLLPAHTAPACYDGAKIPEEPVNAVRIQNRWHCLTSPIPSMTETLIHPKNDTVCVSPGETVETELPLDMIYTGYPAVDVKTSGKVKVELRCVETTEGGSAEHYVFTHDEQYVSTVMHSAGKLRVKIVNDSEDAAELKFGFMASHFPVDCRAVTETDDETLNLVTEVCAHTLKYCRQTLHLDSGRHCEPMACTGDYYIETLMTMYTFGDMRLSAFDVRRTAQLLRYNDGRMFHTTYSLIWVQMLWDVYNITGEREILTDCEDALILLLERFETYLGENGMIEYPPDYMFVDWLIPDGISTHHPPKALGQTCLNMFYYGALQTAAKIWDTLGEDAIAEKQRKDAEKLHSAVDANLFDRERGLFFEGLNTPEREDRVHGWLPQNVEKRYYRKHANVLAAYFGFYDKKTNCDILHKVMNDDSLGLLQPYFTHFLLEAVYRNGLRDEYTLRILEQWKEPVLECPLGLAEGFHKPEPGYSFDHSHAWGGTPAYSLPQALTGLRILEPGYKKISFDPSLLGLGSANVQIPTPFGMIEVKQKRDAEAEITVPNGIEVVVEN